MLAIQQNFPFSFEVVECNDTRTLYDTLLHNFGIGDGFTLTTIEIDSPRTMLLTFWKFSTTEGEEYITKRGYTLSSSESMPFVLVLSNLLHSYRFTMA